MKNMEGNNLKDIPGNHNSSTVLGRAPSHPLSGSLFNMSFYSAPLPMGSHLSSVAPPPVQRNAQQNGPSLNTLVTDSSPKSTVNSTIQAPRRKVVVEGKLQKDALDVYLKLPHKHYHTGRVLSQVGKAYLAHQASPYSLKGMDVYSTVLYHLKEDMKLSYLAQEFISIDGLAPQSWCAMGNCYSLQKDHEAALIIFQRAVQLESRFAYAHTLCGHEYVLLDDFESGFKCYQKALRVDAKTL